MSAFTHCVSIAADHPCLAGHFPDDPIVPGVLILQHVVEAASLWLGAPQNARVVQNVKFLSPLRPADVMTIMLEGNPQALRFRCACEDRLLAQGTLTL